MTSTIIFTALFTLLAVAWIGSVVALLLAHARINKVESSLDQARGMLRAHHQHSLQLGRTLIAASTNFYSFMRMHRHAAVTIREFEKQQNGEPSSPSTQYGIVPSSELFGAVRKILGELNRRRSEEKATADAWLTATAPPAADDCPCGTGACSTAEAEAEETDGPGMDAPIDDVKPAYRPKVEHCCNPGRNGCSSRTSPTADI